MTEQHEHFWTLVGKDNEGPGPRHAYLQCTGRTGCGERKTIAEDPSIGPELYRNAGGNGGAIARPVKIGTVTVAGILGDGFLYQGGGTGRGGPVAVSATGGRGGNAPGGVSVSGGGAGGGMVTMRAERDELATIVAKIRRAVDVTPREMSRDEFASYLNDLENILNGDA